MTAVFLASNWWALAVRGGFAILFGVIALLWPGISLAALVALFAAFAFADGVFAIIAGVRGFGRSDRWGAFLLEGVVGIAVAAVSVLWPAITVLVFVFLVASWAAVTGVLEIVAAVRLRREIRGEWLLALGGVASLAFALLLGLNPGAGAIVLLWLIGAYAVVFGIVLVGLSLRMRSVLRHAGPFEGMPRPV